MIYKFVFVCQSDFCVRKQRMSNRQTYMSENTYMPNIQRFIITQTLGENYNSTLVHFKYTAEWHSVYA